MTKENDKNVKLEINQQKSVSLPVRDGVMGPSVIDVSALYKETGMFTYDQGFMSTASCSSKITYIDGDAGILMHRGYPIEELAEHSDFMEVAYLLLNGELPNQPDKDKFISEIKHHTLVNEQLQFMFRSFQRRSHPMAVMVGAVASLSAFYHDSLDINDEKQREIAALRMIAKIPTLGAMAYKYSIGQPFVYPQNKSYFSQSNRQNFHSSCRS